MNVEDSYEGAVRRLQRLETAGIVAMESVPSDAIGRAATDGNSDRMRELEELATLACEENERLKGELDAVLQELDGTRRAIGDARGEVAQARQELDGAQREIEQLRGSLFSLQQQVASTQQAFASAPQQPFASAPQQPFTSAPQQPFATAPTQPFAEAPSAFAPSPFATDASLDEDYGYPPKSSGKGARYFFLVAIVGAGIAALAVMRPWDRPHAAPIVVEQPAPPPPVVTAPVVTAPPAPKIEPTVPKIVPTIPKAAPVAAHEPRGSRTRSERKHAKHHAAKKHGSAKPKEAALDHSDDPLGGTGL